MGCEKGDLPGFLDDDCCRLRLDLDDILIGLLHLLAVERSFAHSHDDPCLWRLEIVIFDLHEREKKEKAVCRKNFKF
jgi:hypothetical protein